MRKKIFFLLIAVTAILFSCNKDRDRKVQINPLNELEQVDNLLSEISEKPQKLTVPSNKETTVTGAKGTIIHVDPNRLETVDGSALGDNIQIELLEMTDNSSMLLNNAQTVSNGQILITGGAYYLNMTSDGKQLKMKRGKGLEVEFPKLAEDEMALFLGERDSLGQINWIETEQKFKASDTDQTQASNFEMIAPDTIPMEQADRIPSDSTVNMTIGQKEIETYEAVEIMNFGWINCDRFLNDPEPKRDIKIIVSNESISGARFYAVFKDINSIMTEYYFKGHMPTFRNIPEGRELQVFALSVINDKPHFFETTLNTSVDDQVQVTFSERTQAYIKERFERIN